MRYYHAGVELKAGKNEWSPHTRQTLRAAIKEAKKMQRHLGGRGVVESWDRSWGMHPCTRDAVMSCWYVDECKE